MDDIDWRMQSVRYNAIRKTSKETRLEAACFRWLINSQSVIEDGEIGFTVSVPVKAGDMNPKISLMLAIKNHVAKGYQQPEDKA